MPGPEVARRLHALVNFHKDRYYTLLPYFGVVPSSAPRSTAGTAWHTFALEVDQLPASSWW